MSAAAIESKWLSTYFHALNSRSQTQFFAPPCVHDEKLEQSRVQLPEVLHCCVSCGHSSPLTLWPLSWTRCQPPCSCRCGARSASSVWLPRSWTSWHCLPVVFSIPVARTGCSMSVILVKDELLLRRAIYQRFDFWRRILQLQCRLEPPCSSIVNGLWSALTFVKEMSTRCVNSTQPDIMRLRRQNRKTKFEDTTHCRSLVQTSCQLIDLRTGQISACCPQDVSPSANRSYPVVTFNSLDWWLAKSVLHSQSVVGGLISTVSWRRIWWCSLHWKG